MATNLAPGGAGSSRRVTDPGALVVRRSIQIDAPPDRVWQEFDSFERFRAWWSTDEPSRKEWVVAYEPRVGARVEMPCEWPGGACVFAGDIKVFEPNRELTFELRVEGAGWPAPTYVTIRLTPNGYGTLVEILHYGFEALGETATTNFADFEGGWDLRELRSLKATVEAGR